jgi:signal transduction histidine kinase
MSGGVTSAMIGGTAILLGVVGLVSGTMLRRRRRSAVESSPDADMLRRAACALTKTGGDFLPAVVQEIASALKAELTFIGELVGDHRIQTVAVNRRGEVAENFAFVLTDSPSGQILNCHDFSHTDGVRDLFPRDPHLAGINARGCIGVALIGTRHEPIGVIMAASTQPLTHPANASLLALFAGRVAAEMERAQTERELRMSEEHLRQVQRVDAIGRLAGGVAHDFNNLLMIMIGYGEILRDRDGASQEITELLAAANRATVLTKQLLAFGRRQVLQARRIDVNCVVTQVQSMLAPVIGAQVQLTTSLDPTLPNVEADPGQIEQVLVNLALNARDAMPGGGTLTLETRTELVRDGLHQMPPGTYVRLAVSDTGLGMSADVQAHIFEPFYTTKGSSGTGLGLSSVYGIVKQSGGYIWCTSEPGHGSTFTIYLPPVSSEAAAPAVPEITLEPAAKGTERVLVVDDEPGVRRLLTRLLSANGYTVFEADSGEAALALMSAAVPQVDLVVTDIVMPGMTGTRLAEEIERRWPRVRLLFVTGHTQSAALGPSAITSRIPVLGKPFTPARIAGAVRETFDSTPH